MQIPATENSNRGFWGTWEREYQEAIDRRLFANGTLNSLDEPREEQPHEKGDALPLP